MWSGRKEFSVIQGRVSFVIRRPSTDCIRPPTVEKTICFTQSTDLHVNLMQKYVHRNSQKNVYQISGYPVVQSIWHIKLTITLLPEGRECWNCKITEGIKRELTKSQCSISHTTSPLTLSTASSFKALRRTKADQGKTNKYNLIQILSIEEVEKIRSNYCTEKHKT